MPVFSHTKWIHEVDDRIQHIWPFPRFFFNGDIADVCGGAVRTYHIGIIFTIHLMMVLLMQVAFSCQYFTTTCYIAFKNLQFNTTGRRVVYWIGPKCVFIGYKTRNAISLQPGAYYMRQHGIIVALKRNYFIIHPQYTKVSCLCYQQIKAFYIEQLLFYCTGILLIQSVAWNSRWQLKQCTAGLKYNGTKKNKESNTLGKWNLTSVAIPLRVFADEQ